MIAADLNNRRKLFLLILKSLRIYRQRPSFTTERDLIVCQVQAASSYKASARVRGVFAEILTPDDAAPGVECAGYRNFEFRFISGRALPAITSQSLQLIRGEFGYDLKASRMINTNVTEYCETFVDYRDAREEAISWVRGCLFETGDLDRDEPEQTEPRAFSLSFSPGRARKALRWMQESERRALIGDAEAQSETDDTQAGTGLETSAGGQQAQNTPTFLEPQK